MATNDVLPPAQVANRLLNAELLRAEAAMHRDALDEDADWYEQRKERAARLRHEAEELLDEALDHLMRNDELSLDTSVGTITFEDATYQQLLEWAADRSTIPVKEDE